MSDFPAGVLNAQMLACLAEGDQYLPEPVARLLAVFCGCGDTHSVWDWVADRLNRDSRSEWDDPGDGKGPEWIARYLLDHLELTEHGTTVRCSWPTADGVVVLGFLCRWGVNWEDKGPWVDAEGVSWGIR